MNAIKKKKFKQLFFYFLVSEVFLLGSGQDFHVLGGLTLRMLNFLIAIFITIITLIKKERIPDNDISLLFLYTLTLILAICIGLLFEPSSFERVFLDIKPLSFFYLLPYFVLSIKSIGEIETIVNIFKRCMQIMIITYLGYMFAMEILNLVPFEVVYTLFKESDSIMMRDQGYAFFYKGFVFIPVSSILFVRKREWIWFVMSVMAVYLTYTRGFYVMLIIGFLLNYLFKQNVSFLRIVGLVLLIIIIYQIVDYFQIFAVNEARQGGDKDRILTMQQVVNAITPFSFIMGHGFGHGVPLKPVHMEMCYMEILHKQGLVGLFFWFYLIFKILRFHSLEKLTKQSKDLIDFFVLSGVMIYIQSLFNPYLLNPIGMTMVLLSYVSCKLIAKNENTLRNSSL